MSEVPLYGLRPRTRFWAWPSLLSQNDPVSVASNSCRHDQVYFTEDPNSPTSRTVFQNETANVKKSLGIGEVPHCADVFLPAVAGL